MGLDTITTTGIITIAAIISAGILSITFISISVNLNDTISRRNEAEIDKLGTSIEAIKAYAEDPQTVVCWVKNTGVEQISNVNMTEVFIDDMRIKNRVGVLVSDSDVVNKGYWDPGETLRFEIYLESGLTTGKHKLELVTANSGGKSSISFYVS